MPSVRRVPSPARRRGPVDGVRGRFVFGAFRETKTHGSGEKCFFFLTPPPNSTNEACFCCVVKQRNKPWGCFGLYLGEYREYTIHLAHGLRGLQSPIAICICICINCHDMDPVGKTHGRQHFFSGFTHLMWDVT